MEQYFTFKFYEEIASVIITLIILGIPAIFFLKEIIASWFE